jgi:GNAT superfamily N-acetyltransferase
LEAADIEGLERATVEGIAPAEVCEIGRWLAAFDDGTISRSKSAVPLRHDVGPEALDEIEAAYHSRGLPPAFRLADVPELEPVGAELVRRGYAVHQATVVETGSTAQLAAFSEGSVRILDKPDEAWAAVFAGEGFDPVDGAYRVAAFSRAPDAIFAAAGSDGDTKAVGIMTFGHGWGGIHGMRTAPAHRGKGHAGAVLAALGRAALARGVSRGFLDVEEANPARRLYRAAGFSPIWRYGYWRS